MKNWFTVREIAQMMEITEGEVRRLCRLGRITPASRDSGVWMIDMTFTILLPPGYQEPYKGEPRKKRGRPPGSKNVMPYPKGVKRPLKKPKDQDMRRKKNREARNREAKKKGA